MAMNPLTDHGPNHRADDDDEKKQGKRKMYMNMELKDNQTSETNNKKMLTPSKSKHVSVFFFRVLLSHLILILVICPKKTFFLLGK